MGVHGFGLCLLHEMIGHDQRPELQAALKQSLMGQELHDMRAEAADGPFFDGDQNLVVLRQLPDKVAVEGLCKTGIRDGGRQPGRIEVLRGEHALGEARSI